MQRRIREFLVEVHEPYGVGPEEYGFVDMFCGIGGASEGARQAGLRVCLAVDYCNRLLAIHKANHPGVKHMCSELPSLASVRLPSFGRWHLHGSPPCTKVSNANRMVSPEERAHALSLVRWFVEFALNSGATTWSMEQVPVAPVIEVVEQAMSRCKDKIDYCVVDCAKLGVPQHRKRLFAGSPVLINKIRRRRASKTTVCDYISNPRGTHTRLEATSGTSTRIKDGVKVKIIRRYTWDQLCRPLNETCHTITAHNGLRWANPGTGQKTFKMNSYELKLLQTFPADYRLDCSDTLGRLGVGNAVPPMAMREFLKPITRKLSRRQTLADPGSPSHCWVGIGSQLEHLR